jgi:hypothetical protein
LGRGDISNVAETDLPIDPKIEDTPIKFYGAHPLGRMQIVTSDDPSLLPLRVFGLPNLYWHLPFPFAEHHIVRLTGNTVELSVPIVLSLGQDYLVLTREGFKRFSVYDFKPKALDDSFTTPSIVYLRVKLTYDITDIEKYAIIHKYNNWRADLGIKYDLTRIMRGDELGTGLVAQNLSRLIEGHELFDDFLAALEKIESGEPYTGDSPQDIFSHILADVTRQIARDPSVLLTGASELFDFRESTFGIDILDRLVAELYEDKSSHV